MKTIQNPQHKVGKKIKRSLRKEVESNMTSCVEKFHRIPVKTKQDPLEQKAVSQCRSIYIPYHCKTNIPKKIFAKYSGNL